jgi:hypothetical protein
LNELRPLTGDASITDMTSSIPPGANFKATFSGNARVTMTLVVPDADQR